MSKFLSAGDHRKRIIFGTLLSAILLTGICGSEPVHATFADSGPQNGIYVATSGTFYSDASSALAEINAIRLEACQIGVPDPRDPSRALTEADYVELKWSCSLEELAKYRAQEATVAGSSIRPDGGSLGNLSVGSVTPDGETYSITDSCQSMTDVAYGWSLGKDAWISQTGDYSATSYGCLINPDYDYVGMAQYYPDNGSGKYTFTAEYRNTDEELDQTMESAAGYVSGNVEVAAGYVTALTLSLDYAVGAGESTTTTLQATVSVNGVNYGTYPVVGYVSYYSDDESIATVDSTGVITVVGAGETNIYATSGGVTASVAVSGGASSAADSGDGSGAASEEHVHTPGEAVRENEVAATCQAEGYYEEVVYCTSCGAEISRTPVTTAKTDHVTELQNAKEATCQAEGYTGDQVCTVCGSVVTPGQVIAKTDHTPGEAVRENEVAATCQAEGSYEEVVYCTTCWTEISRTPVTTAKTDHVTELRNAKEATCQEEGYTGDQVCTVCGSVVTPGQVIAKTDHTPGEAVRENEIAATCQAEGSYEEVTYCTVCGAEISRTKVTTEKAEHVTELRNAKEATCQEEGYTGDQVCTVCGSVVTQGQVIAKKTDHTPGDAVKENEVEATCLADGSYEEVVYCTVCGTEISRTTVTTAKTGHQAELRNAVAATCERDGYTGDQICKFCNTVLETGTSIPMTGHVNSDTVVENKTDATCSQEGSYDEVIYCTVCGKELSRTHRTIEKTDHTTSIVNAKEASDTEDGYTGDTVCTICGAVIKQGEVIPAAGGYVITAGEQQTWQSGSEDGLSVSASGALSEFKEVKVDSAVLDASCYTVKQGSSQEGIVVTLNASYLETLSAGAYKLDLVWEGGSAQTSFIVSKVAESTSSAATADTGLVYVFGGMMAAAVLIILALVIYRKKHRFSRK